VFGIVWHLAVQKLIDRKMADRCGTDGVTIRRTAGNCGNPDIATCPTAVLDDKRLTKHVLEPLGQNAREDIGRAARRIGYDDPHRAVGPTAVLAARAQNMPNDTIERAIKKGTGEIEGGIVEELMYEGYGPGGVAIIVEAATDNRNRTAADIRSIFAKNHGNLAASGAVSYMFRRKGQIALGKKGVDEDKLMEIALEAGAEDLKDDGSAWYIVTPPDALEKVKEALIKAGITPASAEVGMVPQNYIKLTGPQATQMVRLIEAFEEHDDVQHVYANFDIDESEIQAAVGAN